MIENKEFDYYTAQSLDFKVDVIHNWGNNNIYDEAYANAIALPHFIRFYNSGKIPLL